MLLLFKKEYHDEFYAQNFLAKPARYNYNYNYVSLKFILSPYVLC